MLQPHRVARYHALDALRGFLAVVVLAFHVTVPFGSRLLVIPSFLAVLAFFAMSGFVLARAYDGAVGAFMLRRLVRLWPLYAVCIAVGYVLVGRLPPVLELLWWPIPAFGSTPKIDSPAWSLYYEAWATPVFPLLFWISARSRRVSAALAIGVASLATTDFRFFLASWFVVGTTAAQFDIRFPERVPAWLLWLGKVSFSLYISHQIVLNVGERVGGPWGTVAALPAVFPVAWLCWWAIERPSIALSRRLGRKQFFFEKKNQKTFADCGEPTV